MHTYSPAIRNVSEARVTVREVARLAGVSVATASYALNGRREVSAVTRARVEEVARRLDYQPSHAARGLRAVRSYTVGLILPLRPARHGAGPFLEALGGIAQVLAPEGFDVLVAHSSSSPEELALCRRLMLSRKVDALVLTRSRVDDDRFPELSARRFPFVVYGRAPAPDILAAEIDNLAAAQLAADHLLALGHEQIAFVGPSGDLTATADRLTGFRKALERAGRAWDPALIARGELSAEGGAQAMRSLLLHAQPAPTAVFVGSDAMAPGARQAARTLGLEPGRDLAFVSFGEAATAAYLDPPMTTIDHRPFEVGLVLGRMLLDRLEGRAIEPLYQTLQPRLIVQASSRRQFGEEV
jgi:LacI family transcriptional regulator